MVASFTDLQDGDAKNLIFGLVGGYYQAHSTCFPAYLSMRCFKSWKAPCSYQNIIGISTNLCQSVQNYTVCSRFFSALWRTRLNNVADKPSPCLTPLLMTKGLLFFPSTITLPWAPSSGIFMNLSVFLGIPKLASDSSSFF